MLVFVLTRNDKNSNFRGKVRVVAMFIEKLVIDGFKSYATRTEVSGFDSQFNAITGLNGSGKSNILDSICFVLGISNLTQVIYQLWPGKSALGDQCEALLTVT